MIGSLIIWVALVAAITSASLYAISFIRQNTLQIARGSFYLSIIGVITASAMLLLYILQHRFEYHYISSYSSRDLPTSLLITTFWAGQEGSFLLWALFASLIGFFLQFFVQKKNMEREAMTVYAIILAFLLFLLAIKSPFQYVWDAVKEVPKGFIPEDGKGLNPLLQSFWMIIHPPVLFLGFAALAVPFVLAITALWQKKYTEWLRIALPWVLFGTITLGSGLILGGYWAYGVLGWGGWWGWDPVENSSLIPWIVSIILIHTMIIQMMTGRLVRTNFILSVLAYVLVIYSTFLTRSGILANASVHSFVDPGMFAYTLLVVWLAALALGGFGMIYLRRKDLNIPMPVSSWLTRESSLSIATIVMGVCAAIILFGTSKPLFSTSIVESSFYDRTNLPLAVLMTLLLGFSLRLKWNIENRTLLLKKLLIPGILAAIGLVFLIIVGVRDWLIALLIFSSLFALFISIENGYRLVKEQPRFIGGSLSHIGLAMLLLAIIASGRYGQKQTVTLPMGQPKVIFGDTLIYVGTSPTPDKKTEIHIHVVQNGKAAILKPVMFESSYNNSLMRNPDYISYLTKDFYIEPVSIEPGEETSDQNILELVKDEALQYGPIQITFRKFDLSSHGKGGGMGTGGTMTIGAVLETVKDGAKQTLIPTTTYKMGEEPEMKTAFLKNSPIGFQLVTMNVAPTKGGKSSVKINVVGLESMTHGKGSKKPETLIAEVSVKPFMNLVWIASVLIIGGLTVAMTRRLKVEPTT
jgi:cytochrome c-type biogenesis protein CcmF